MVSLDKMRYNRLEAPRSFMKERIVFMTGKRVYCLFLAVLMLACFLLPACGNTNSDEGNETTLQETEPAQEAKVMKILTLGSSSSVDSNHMINLVAATEGIGEYEEIVIGTLYYSGCSLERHVKFLTENSPKYTLYLSSTATPDQPPKTMDNITMQDALRFDYWDIIVLQESNGKSDLEDSFTGNNIPTIRDYVNTHKLNPLAQFAWHFTGVPATDPDLLSTYPQTPNPYVEQMSKYNNDRKAYFAPRAANIEKFIATDESYKFIVCSGTATMNASTTYLVEKDLLRDYTHATDLSRVILSYTWYANLMGLDKLEAIHLNAIPKAFLKSTQNKLVDRPLTDMEKAIILESVNNALANPYKITQSQYTVAP